MYVREHESGCVIESTSLAVYESTSLAVLLKEGQDNLM